MFNIDTFRAILSFDLSSIPANAIIDSATLTVTRQSLSGSVSQIQVDIKSGTFSGQTAVTLAAYGSAASASNIAQLPIPTTASWVPIPSNVFRYFGIGPGAPRTQFRLKATTTASFSPNLLTLVNGQGGTQAPTLTVTYVENTNRYLGGNRK